jgi:hypothetical protein
MAIGFERMLPFKGGFKNRKLLVSFFYFNLLASSVLYVWFLKTLLLVEPRSCLTMVNYIPWFPSAIVIVVKQWDSLLHKYSFNCHTTMIWLPWLP